MKAFDRDPTKRQLRQIRAVSVLVCIALAGSLGILRGRAEQAGASQFLRLEGVSGKRGGNLVTAISSDPQTFNRMLTAGLATVTIAGRLAADLVHINRATLELEPSLATRWDSAPDGRTYTLHLRRGVRFSDGQPFTADDVLFTFQVLQDPKSAAVQDGQVRVDGAFPAVSKVDSHTVRLTFPKPVGMGLRLLDSVPMLPRHRLQQAYEEGTISSAWGPTVSPQEVAGLGPFRLREYVRGVRVVLERNPFYWKKDRGGETLPYLDTLTFLIIPDRNAEALRFQSGELDIVSLLVPESFASLRRSGGRGGTTVRDLGPGLYVDFLWFNLNPGSRGGKPFVDPEKRELFDRPEFRRAVSQALDRQGISRYVYMDRGTPQSGPISSGNTTWKNTKVAQPAHDPGQARRLLAQLGLSDSNGDGVLEFGRERRPLEIVLSTARGNPARERMAQVIRDNLSKVGIRADLQFLLPNELVVRIMNSFEYEAILFGFAPTDVVPDLQTDLWYSHGKNHFWFPLQQAPRFPWEAEIDRLTTSLLRSTDPGTRRDAFFRIQEIWARELPAIPTVAPNILVGWSNRVGNVRPSIMVPHLLWNAEELTKTAR